MTIRQLARRFKVSPVTITNWKRKAGLVRKRRRSVARRPARVPILKLLQARRAVVARLIDALEAYQS